MITSFALFSDIRYTFLLLLTETYTLYPAARLDSSTCGLVLLRP
jgi:hypothetical protein